VTTFRLALRNLLSAGLRTWLNAAVLSLVFLAILTAQALLKGMNEQTERAMVATEYGGGQFSHPEYDRIFEEALVTLDDGIRIARYHELDRIIVEEAAVVPLYYDQVVRFVPESLAGLGSNPMNLLHLKHAYWAE
jgi:ABC-type transport system substrate-binding protein